MSTGKEAAPSVGRKAREILAQPWERIVDPADLDENTLREIAFAIFEE